MHFRLQCVFSVCVGAHAEFQTASMQIIIARDQDSAEIQGNVCDPRIPRPCPACAIRMPHVTKRCTKVVTEADILYINRNTAFRTMCTATK
jgi:hypothetical protein